jgi:SnoaL-like domain
MFKEENYRRYIQAFNARDYTTLESFFTDDFVLENAGFKVQGKAAFRTFYHFFHHYCRESVTLLKFFPGDDAFVANVMIRFEGLEDLSPSILAEKGYAGMTPIPKGVVVDLDFLILYSLNTDGLIKHIKGAVHVPAPK